MSDTFKVKVNNSLEFEFSDTDISKLDLVEMQNSGYHLLHNNKSFTISVITDNFMAKNYRIKVNNKVYEVDILDELDLAIQEIGFSNGSSKHISIIRAPMPGLILDVYVESGQSVKEKDDLLVLEAMKMESTITSPRDGVVKSVSIAKGDAIDKGQLLIEFE